MDLQESKKIIQTGMVWAGWSDTQKEAMRLALEAIEKQAPKDVTDKHDNGGFCPICQMHNLNTYQYCNNCGQNLKWK